MACDLASTVSAATLRRKARVLREELLAESLADRHRAARATRRVELEPARDGMSWLHLLLPAADVALIADRLDRATQVALTGDEAAGVEHSTASGAVAPDQVRADTARDLLLYGALPSGAALAGAVASVRPSVHVTVPVLTLLADPAEAGTSAVPIAPAVQIPPAVLDGYGPIDDDTARRLAAHAPSFTRILTHPVTGTVLDVDRTRYRPPADLKRWLEVRDGSCRFPGCNRSASRSEIDHTEDWADGNTTAFDNLAHLCTRHHHLKHESTWSVRHHAGGVLEWTSPSGRTHTTQPRHHILAEPPPAAPPTSSPRTIDLYEIDPPF
jgi:hypothetical protein